METTTDVAQLFKILCYNSIWKYVALWKLQETSPWLLTFEDAYVTDKRSVVNMENSPFSEFISIDSLDFACEVNAQRVPELSIEMAVANMTRYSYSLGEGIIGKTASMNRHKWTSKGELKSNLLLEYPKELQLQIAAGIKTFVFVPVLPLGVLQLGSLLELDEDLTMVAQIKDLFCAYQYSLESRSTVDLGMEFQFYMPFSRSLFDNDSDCLTIATELINPINSHLSAMQDSTTLNIDRVMTNELLLDDYDIMPELKVQPDELLSQDDGFCQIQFSEEVILDALTSELLSDHSEENLIHNSNMTPVGTTAFDQSVPYFREEEDDSIPFISHCLALKEATISDFSMEDFLQYDCDFFQINGTSTEYGEEFDASMNIMLDNIYLDGSDVSDRQIFIQCNSPVEFHDKEWIANLSDADNFSELLSTFMEEVPQPIGSLVEEPGEFINARMTECSPDASTVEQVGFSDKKDFASSGKCPGSCIPQFKAGDLLPSEIFDLGTYEISNTCPNSNVVMPSPIEDQQDMKCRLLKNCFNTSHGRNRKHKKSDPHKSRPRDRQLIQDHIRELRGLIPNGSKCSIDELLEQAIKHMMFLESVPIQAEKLKQSARAKIPCEDLNVHAARVQTDASKSCDMGVPKTQSFPLIIEDLDQPDQMLIQVQCRNCVLFLEIAQAFKRLRLSIMEATLESRLDGQWARYVVEVPKGFNSMDILWPLMRLLQPKF